MNTYDKAEGKPLPSLVNFGCEVAAVLGNNQFGFVFIVVTLPHTWHCAVMFSCPASRELKVCVPQVKMKAILC